MRLITFIVGVGAGYLLGRSSGSQGVPERRGQAASAGLTDFRPGAGATGSGGTTTGGERDFPTHAPPRTDAELRDRIRAQLDRTI
ncbi:MAG TPA: hypothetical protein VEA35_00060, partial [Ramlibacter sp.]|nr:hypothetical protein [Ramlibacter sp.]